MAAHPLYALALYGSLTMGLQLEVAAPTATQEKEPHIPSLSVHDAPEGMSHLLTTYTVAPKLITDEHFFWRNFF